MKKLFYLYLLFIISWGCSYSSKTEIHQGKRDRIINVREKIKAINIEDVMIGAHAWIYPAGNCFIISDHKSLDKMMHIFNKNSLKYKTSITTRGKGPGEIVIMGNIAFDELRRKFFVTDHGKQVIFSYDLDSVLAYPKYMPGIKMRLENGRFPDRYQYINDTLCVGKIMEPIGISDFRILTAKWNISTGEIIPMKYTHPDIEKKRITFAVSPENGVYAECYSHHDLISICTLDGELKYNIYGDRWDSRTSNKIHHYGPVVFCRDKILASYSGGNNFSDEYYPTKFLLFDLNGNYLQTIETEYRIIDFFCDMENNRIIMSLDDEMQLAYLELDGII